MEDLSPFSKLVYSKSAVAYRSSGPKQEPQVKPPRPVQKPEPKTLGRPNGKPKSPILKKGSPRLEKATSLTSAVPASAPYREMSTPSPQRNAHHAARIEIRIPAASSPLKTNMTVPKKPPRPPDTSSEPQKTPLVEPHFLAAKPRNATPVLPPNSLPDCSLQRPTDASASRKKQIDEAAALPRQESPEIATSSTSPRVRVEVNLPPSSVNVDHYITVDYVPDAPMHLSNRRDDIDEPDVLGLGGGLDLGQRSERALRELCRCFREIFHCESLMKGGRPAPSNIVAWTTDDQLTLTASSLKKTRALMQAAIDLKCFSSVPATELLRIQRLCDGSLRRGTWTDVRLEPSGGESAVLIWAQQLPEVEIGLKAARTTLCTMSGGCQDKRLYSEDIIAQCVGLFRTVLEGLIIPVAEMRSSVPTFRFLTHHKKAILSLLTSVEKLLSMMSTLVASIELSEMVLNSLEDCASRLIFVENAHTEKESVVPIQKFDSLRLVGIDLICHVFQRKPVQRVGILNSILASLEKLPMTKSSARHFKLSDGGNIQPVSALIMRLVQASAGFVDEKSRKHGGEGSLGDGEASDEDNGKPNGLGLFRFAIKSENQANLNPSAAIQELQTVVNFLTKSYNETATYICNFLIARAKQSTKTGDSPYRNLLEMFIEDFATCLENPGWPAASTLLRVMLHMSLNIVTGDKAPAGARSSVSAVNMALELMGMMGAAMAKIRSNVQNMSNPSDGSDADDDLWTFLTELAETVLEDRASLDLVTEWSGPYRTVLEYLDQRSSADPYLSSAISFVVLDWAKNALAACRSSADPVSKYAALAYRLRMMITNRNWLSSEFSFTKVLPTHAKLSYYTTIVNSELYTLYRPVLHISFQSMSREEVTVRSKSLKSVTQLIETDPTILDGKAEIYHTILEEGLGDPSPQVRESALGLIGTCLALRPHYEDVTRPAVLERLTDTSIGVRKRSMKLARDLYLRSKDQEVRTEICRTLLIRLQDQEDSVRDLARQLVEGIWITPYAFVNTSGAAQTSMSNHVALVVRALNSAKVVVGEHVILALVKAIIGGGVDMKPDSQSLNVCERLVSGMFDLVSNSDTDDANVPSGAEALQVLVVFAKVAHSLFTFEQVRSLRPYIDTIPQLEDQATSIAALHIYRRVIPTLSTVHKQFLEETRGKLQQFLLKGISAIVLDELIACLWAILRLLQNTVPMTKLVASSLMGTFKVITRGDLSPTFLTTFSRYCLIVGTVAKYGEGDLEENKAEFVKSVRMPVPFTVSKCIVDSLVPLAMPSSTHPKEVRKASFEAVAMVCQANPKNYVAPKVYAIFQEAFKERNQLLESLFLTSFLSFLLQEEKKTAEASDGKEKKETKRELTVIGGTNYDDVSSATTQRFLDDITRISLQDVSPHSKLALEVLGSINRQGLVHPKQTGVTFITLETCNSSVISELAFKEHRLLHDKHEQVLEREYAKAIQSAYNYQRDVLGDSRGAREKPDGTWEPKLMLMMEVLKISRSKNRQKFLEKLVRLVDFDYTKIKVTDTQPHHVLFSRFVLENLAFFDYITLGEVLNTVNALEKLFYSTGSPLAQSIESDIFQVRMDMVTTASNTTENGESSAPPPPPPVNVKRLCLLTAGSMILSVLYEVRTYLRRLWNLGLGTKKEKSKLVAKDLSKAPVKIQGMSGDKLWEDMTQIMDSLNSEETMMEQCRAFVELMTIDKEVKVGENDEEEGEGPETPSGDEYDMVDGTGNGSGRGRKRKSGPGSSTPSGRKKRARSSSRPRQRGRPRKSLRPEDEIIDDDMSHM